MIRSHVKFSAQLIMAFVALNLIVIGVSNVPSKVTESDEAIFKTALGLQKPQTPMHYEEELFVIKKLQVLVLKEAPGNDGIPKRQSREPENLFKFKSGLCFDRSRTLDKLFQWAGFESRHVYVLYAAHPKTGAKLSFWKTFFTEGTDSHAVTEVKTSHGWLVVDSNTPWISLAADGEPVRADHIYAQAYRFASLPAYWNRPFWAIRGMYSRHGQFYWPYIPYPQLNWTDLFSWLAVG